MMQTEVSLLGGFIADPVAAGGSTLLENLRPRQAGFVLSDAIEVHRWTD